MLTPMELKSKQAQPRKRRYDKEEMDQFLELVYENYQELYEKNSELKKKIKTLSEGIQYYRSIENTLQQALVLAEKTSNETKDAAILKAEIIEKEANAKARQIVGAAEKEYNDIKSQCVHLVQQFNQYKLQLKQAASAQIELIESATFDIYSPELNAIYQEEAPVEGIDMDVAEQATSVIKTDTIVKNPVSDTEEEKKSALEEDNEFKQEAASAMEDNVSSVQKKQAEKDVDNILPMDELYPNIEETSVQQPADAVVLEPIKAVVKEPLEAPIQEVKTAEPIQAKTEKAETQTLDSLLNDLNIGNKKKDEEDPFEFLGSIDDF